MRPIVKILLFLKVSLGQKKWAWVETLARV
jgi:hypothetical protein